MSNLKIEVKRAGIRLLPKRTRMKMLREQWNRQNRQSTFGYISHLVDGEWDADEFALAGRRLADRMLERYHDYGTVPADQATILEIGCGVGRFLRPFSDDFRKVIGVDLSEEMLADARRYCEGIANVDLRRNDGATLDGIGEATVDMVVSGGVFQHITVLDAIHSYVREALRVLRPGGVFLFQFEGTRTSTIGLEQTGAKITARGLDQALRGAPPFRICEVSIDPADPVRNIVCVIQRTAEPSGASFRTHQAIERPFVIGVYDGIQTHTDMARRLQQPAQRLTFYDD